MDPFFFLELFPPLVLSIVLGQAHSVLFLFFFYSFWVDVGVVGLRLLPFLFFSWVEFFFFSLVICGRDRTFYALLFLFFSSFLLAERRVLIEGCAFPFFLFLIFFFFLLSLSGKE